MLDVERAVLLDVLDAVFAVNGGLLRAGDELGGPAGITAAQWQVLGLLEHGPDTAASVARRRGLRRQSVQEIVDRLIAAGLLDRRPNPADRRAPLLQVTEKGTGALERVTEAREPWLDGLLEGLDRGDVDRALAVLCVLRERVGVPPRDKPDTSATGVANR